MPHPLTESGDLSQKAEGEVRQHVSLDSSSAECDIAEDSHLQYREGRERGWGTAQQGQTVGLTKPYPDPTIPTAPLITVDIFRTVGSASAQ